MKRLIIASNNNGKIKEIKRVLKGLPFEVLSLKDIGLDIDVEEDGITFE
ncbi:non-canonical purine NTP pyrophosphatase, partial [Clostridium perfringens]